MKNIEAHIAFSKFILTTLVVFLFQLTIFSAEVDPDKARKVATNLLCERSNIPLKKIEFSNIFIEKEGNIPLFYTFSLVDKGFVVVSADDAVYPILAYSQTSNFNPDNIPPGASWIFNKYRRQILKAKIDGVQPTNETILEWEKYSSDPEDFTKDPVKIVLPMLTTTWGQGEYYNELCPVDPAGPGGHALVGCGAVAMAQVLNYWHHPWKGNGNHQYVASGYGWQYAYFQNALYNYDTMPTSINSSNLKIAKLMYHCAVSLEMDFGPNSSTASIYDVEDAFRDYFYIDNGVELKLKSSHMATWDDILHLQLDNYQPVCYRGWDVGKGSGHMWVLDGYQGSDHYHMNWGWYGNYDGYYYLTDLTPGDHNFGTSEMAVIKIKPEIHSISGTLTAAGGPYYFKRDRRINSSETLTIEPGTEIYFAGRYKLIVYGQLIAEGTETDSIIFSAEEPTIGWHGIRFYNTNNSSADTSRLKYCKLEHGIAYPNDTPFPENRYGGAIMCTNSGNVVVSNSLFTNNKSMYDGGSIYCDNFSSIIIEGCEFRYSESSAGGAIACWDTSNVLIRDCEIRHCESYEGGGIHALMSNITIDGCTIHHNTAYSGGALRTAQAETQIQNTEFFNNTAMVGGAIDFHVFSTSVLDSVDCYDNTAEDGGAIYI